MDILIELFFDIFLEATAQSKNKKVRLITTVIVSLVYVSAIALLFTFSSYLQRQGHHLGSTLIFVLNLFLVIAMITHFYRKYQFKDTGLSDIYD